MDTVIKATEEQLIAEAALRMKNLGLPQRFIDGLVEGTDFQIFDAYDGSIYSEDTDIDTFVIESDDKYKGYPWALIKDVCNSPEYGDPGADYFLLFVSDDPSQWERERRELAEMEPTVFYCHYSRFLYPDETNCNLFRKKIRLTAEGHLALDDRK